MAFKTLVMIFFFRRVIFLRRVTNLAIIIFDIKFDFIIHSDFGFNSYWWFFIIMSLTFFIISFNKLTCSTPSFKVRESRSSQTLISPKKKIGMGFIKGISTL